MSLLHVNPFTHKYFIQVVYKSPIFIGNCYTRHLNHVTERLFWFDNSSFLSQFCRYILKNQAMLLSILNNFHFCISASEKIGVDIKRQAADFNLISPGGEWGGGGGAE